MGTNVQGLGVSPNDTKRVLSDALVVGAKIKIGEQYAKRFPSFFEYGQVIELVEGWFEHDNGLYVEDRACPSWWDNDEQDFQSIYHLFGNKFEDWMDCEIVQ